MRGLFLSGGLAVAATFGCGAADADLEILGNVRPDEQCEYSTDVSLDCEDRQIYCEGYLDIAFEQPYVAHLLVRNTGSDAVRVDGGWRNAWFEPSHTPMISGRGEAARRSLVLDSVEIEGGEERIVEVDLLGDGFRVFREQYLREVVEEGRRPTTKEASIQLVLEGDASGDTIEASPWEFGLTVSLGGLVILDPNADSALPGTDCCGSPGVAEPCEVGLNYQRASCTLCASCWPEICNGSISPFQCQPPLEACAP